MINNITVSQLNDYISQAFLNDENLKYINLKGEISNFTNHIKTGHFYFTLKDSESSIKAIMFKGNAQKIKFDISNGMKVNVTGSVQIFKRDGTYQIYCNTLEPDGIGGLYLAFEQLKEKLSKKGLFDQSKKKPIPHYPKKIGIVTSKTGAALQDILNILSRRYPICEVIIIPVLVQGASASKSIATGIFNGDKQGDIDVLIVGRGGGSIEDLWAFNEEEVANAIFDCKTPIISAVGHEIDFTIADFVADLRAPTPSAAAELATPDIRTLQNNILNLNNNLNFLMINNINFSMQNLKTLYSKLKNVSPQNFLLKLENDINYLNESLTNKLNSLYETKLNLFEQNVSMLEALSPLKILTRGYSVSFNNEKAIRKIKDVSVDDNIITKVIDGEIHSSVKMVKKIRAKKEQING